MAVAIPYITQGTQRWLWYRLAMTVPTEKAPAACPEGKELPLKGDFPPLKNVLLKSPPGGTSLGRFLRVIAFTARSTTAALAYASPASSAVLTLYESCRMYPDIMIVVGMAITSAVVIVLSKVSFRWSRFR